MLGRVNVPSNPESVKALAPIVVTPSGIFIFPFSLGLPENAFWPIVISVLGRVNVPI